MPSERRLNVHYIIMQAGYWSVYAAHTAYQALLLQERGFSNSAISVMLALRCLSGVVLVPILGAFADRHPKIPLRLITAGCLLLSTIASGLLIIPLTADHPGGLILTSILLMIIGAFELSAYPLFDSMAVQFINAGVNVRYSLGRGFGSLAYASCSLLLGLQAGRFGVESTLVTHTILVALVIVLVLTFPVCPVQTQPKDVSPPQPLFRLLRSNPAFTVMLMGVFFGIAAHMPVANFMVNIIQDRGGTEASLGLALFFMAASELPTAIFFPKLLKRFGSARLLVFAMVFTALKYVIMLSFLSLSAAIASQAIQMLSYGLFTPSSVFYVNDSVPVADRVQGQTAMMMASNGLGGVLGTFIAGPSLTAWGPQGMLAVCLALGSAAAAVTWMAARMGRRTRTSAVKA